jgi:hypothetical protein
MQNKRIAQSPKRVVLENTAHVGSFDRGRSNTFTKGTGYFSHHVDGRIGVDLEVFQCLDMRTLRQLIKQRVWNEQKLKNVYLNSQNRKTQTSVQATTVDR